MEMMQAAEGWPEWVRNQFALLVKQSVHGLNEEEASELLSHPRLPTYAETIPLPSTCDGTPHAVERAINPRSKMLFDNKAQQLLLQGSQSDNFVTGVLRLRRPEKLTTPPDETEGGVIEEPLGRKGQFAGGGARKKNDGHPEGDEPEIENEDSIERDSADPSMGLAWVAQELEKVEINFSGSTWCPVLLTLKEDSKGRRTYPGSREVRRTLKATIPLDGQPRDFELSFKDPDFSASEEAHAVVVTITGRVRDAKNGLQSCGLSLELKSRNSHASKITSSRLEILVPAENLHSFEELHPNPNPRLSHLPTRAVGRNAAATWGRSQDTYTLAASYWPQFKEMMTDHVGKLPAIPSLNELRTLVQSLREHNANSDWEALGISAKTTREAADSLEEACAEGVEWLSSSENYRMFEDSCRAVMSRNPERSSEGWMLPLRDREWRPFQMLVFLSAAISAVTPDHPRRKEVVAIEFPTGGGKTEAYLLLAAFTILHSRRQAKVNNESTTSGRGAKVLMRYPLRLLAAQQFSRAAKVMTKLNVILVMGEGFYSTTSPVRVGLWVGRSLSPNSWEGVTGENLRESLPVNTCALCDQDLQLKLSKSRKIAGGHLCCINPECYFGDKFLKSADGPVKDARLDLIDGKFSDSQKETGVYYGQPDFLLATLDKFAPSPWRSSEVERIINSNLQLIIQDELHMLDDELGSMEGLYQTGLDNLAGGNYKIVAASATTKNTARQVRLLYGRSEVLRVPSAEPRDGVWFVAKPSEKPRTIITGIMPSTFVPFRKASVRLLAAQAQAAQVILNVLRMSAVEGHITPTSFESAVAALDPFWTNLVFFGSRPRLRQVSLFWHEDLLNAARVLAWNFQHPGYVRNFNQAQRLEASSDSDSSVAEIISQLEASIQVEGNEVRTWEAATACLATSMIEVGVDVNRLSLMTFVGQPKGAASYIQAGGRVGRYHQALTYVLYMRSNPRDFSVFEDFESYHARRSDKVEPALLNPFSPGAVKRALPGLAVLAQFGKTNSLRMREASDMKETLDAVIETLRVRAGWLEVPLWLKEHSEDLMKAYDRAFEEGVDRLAKFSDLGSKNSSGLLLPLERQADLFGSALTVDSKWYAPTSMRTVAGEASSFIAKPPTVPDPELLVHTEEDIILEDEA